MPKLIKLDGETAVWAEDEFVFVPDEEPVPAQGDVIVSMARLLGEGDALLSAGRRVGVRLQPHERIEDLAYDLPRLAIVELAFAKFRDGRPYSNVSILRGRLEYRGEVRAIGDVLRDQLNFMKRCGFDAFAVRADKNIDDAIKGFTEFTVTYQASVDEPLPLFRRARTEGGAVQSKEAA